MKRTICIFLAAIFTIASANAQNRGLKTVVIDAGHGGKDAGCVSKDKKTYEKNLVLDIAGTLASKIKEEYPDVNVIQTRPKDEFVTLADRAIKANKAKADLFISIHINATDRGTGPNGYSVHIFGQSSSRDRDVSAYLEDVSQRENEAILLEEDHASRYEGFNPNDPETYILMSLMQNAYLEQSLSFAQIVKKHLKGGPIKHDRGIEQNQFYVLWKTSMPAVLVELGFISNPTDLEALRQKNQRNDIAQRLFESFKEYKQAYDRSQNVDVDTAVAVPAAKPAPVESAAPATEPQTDQSKVYAVQIMAMGKRFPDNDPAFMGYAPKVIKGPKLYKYFISVSTSLDDVKKNFAAIKKKYADSFIVSIEGDTVTRIK